MKIKEIINNSTAWRFTAHDKTQQKALRLFAGASDGIEGLLIDQYGDFLVAILYNPDLIIHQNEILNILTQRFPLKSILIKIRDKKDSNQYQYLHNQFYNKEHVFSCHENQFIFEIHCDPRHDFGLYLDTKSARNFISQNSQNKSILNLFSYTCAFGITAMKGEAKAVTNIDPNKDYLNWGKKNADLNHCLFKTYPDTTQDYLARHLRRLQSGKDQAYNMIIVDPPAFLVGRGSNRLARNLWPKWFEALRASYCEEFLIVINDKSLGRKKDLSQFFIEGLGQDIKIHSIEQSLDVSGQKLTIKEDSYYFNPKVFFITRNNNDKPK